MNTGNPLSVIQNRLQVLRAEKEMTESALDALEKEKECIKDILPRLLYELEQTKNNLEQKNAEMKVLDNAVDEVTNTYGSVLYSSLYFSEDWTNVLLLSKTHYNRLLTTVSQRKDRIGDFTFV